jgi:hypothetical protein
MWLTSTQTSEGSATNPFLSGEDQKKVIDHAKVAYWCLRGVFYLNARGDIDRFSIVYVAYSAQLVLLPTVLLLLLNRNLDNPLGFSVFH